LPCLRAGASAFLSKNTDPTQIIPAVTRMISGGIFCSDLVKEKIIDNLISSGKSQKFTE